MTTLIIPDKLPGYNELTTGHWAKRNRVKQEAMDLVGWYIKQQVTQKYTGKVRVKIVCQEPNKMRDASNVRAGAEKIILDALQNCEVIKNDNWKWLDDEPATVELNRMYPKIVVTITEVGA